MLVMRLWPSLAGPWPRCRRSPPVAKASRRLGHAMGMGLWPGPAWLWPGLPWPGPPCPAAWWVNLDQCAGARVRGWSWPGLARGLGEVSGVSGRSPPGGVVRLVARVDVWTSWPWWWISGTPPPASRPSRSRRCPAAPGGIQSPALPGPRPGPAVPRRARPCRPAASACRRSASWPWWTRGKVRIPARMPKPAPGPERRSQAPSRGAEPVFLYLSVCRVAWMDGRMVYILRCLTHPVSSLDDARAARHTRRRWPHAGDDPNAS